MDFTTGLNKEFEPSLTVEKLRRQLISHVRVNDVLMPFERTARDVFEVLTD